MQLTITEIITVTCDFLKVSSKHQEIFSPFFIAYKQTPRKDIFILMSRHFPGLLISDAFLICVRLSWLNRKQLFGQEKGSIDYLSTKN